MKICYIGPGCGIDIPPSGSCGWGAIENLVGDISQILKDLGHEITIYNDPDIEKVCHEVNKTTYDAIHVHYDNFVGTCNRLLKQKFLSTSHYGLIMRPEFYDPGYKQIFFDMMDCPGIVALSPEIANLYRQNGYKGFITHLRNGANVKKFRFAEKATLNKALCLGKCEPRKNQNWLASIVGNQCEIDIIGPQALPFIGTDTVVHRGAWSREQLYNELTNYSTLVLMSFGEAAALVIPESLAAGLSIVVSPWCTANLPLDKKWITVIDTQDKLNNLPAYINGAIGTNCNYRQEIRSFAEQYFDWEIIAKEYEAIINEWKEYNK